MMGPSTSSCRTRTAWFTAPGCSSAFPIQPIARTSSPTSTPSRDEARCAGDRMTRHDSARRAPMPQISINGVQHQIDADPQMPLLWAIRDIIGLTGTKFGCGVGACGACTVHMDGEAVRSCITTLADAQGHEIVTIEGLSADGTHPVQLAWEANNVPQCGYCQAGQIMQAAALIKQTPKPSDQQIVDAMSGNICRCGTYLRIRQAIKSAAEGV